MSPKIHEHVYPNLVVLFKVHLKNTAVTRPGFLTKKITLVQVPHLSQNASLSFPSPAEGLL